MFKVKHLPHILVENWLLFGKCLTPHEMERIPNGGHSFEFDYTMVGITVSGSGIDLEYRRPDRVVTRTTGGVISILDWTFEPLAAGAETN